jgi:hypothetical protein
MGETGVPQPLAEFFRLVVGPFLTAYGPSYSPGKHPSRLTFLQFRRTRYGIDFEFYQAERFETDFITPMILFSLYEQFRIYFGYPIRSPIYTKALVNSSVCSVAPRTPSVRARHRVGSGKGARSQPNPLYFLLRKPLLGAVVQLGGARDAAAAPPI